MKPFQAYPKLNDARERTAESLISAISNANASAGPLDTRGMWPKVDLLAQAYCMTMETSAEQTRFANWYNEKDWTPESAMRYIQKLERERRKVAAQKVSA